MSDTLAVKCLCGEVELQLSGKPLDQFYCHCADCRAANGASYISVAMFAKSNMTLKQGKTQTWTYKSMPRTRCASCGTMLFGEVVGADLIGLKANLLPQGHFKPELHIHCDSAVLPVQDKLPHYRTLPEIWGGSNDTVSW